MITADEFRKWAYFALTQEAESQSAAERDRWFRLAQDWIELADRERKRGAGGARYQGAYDPHATPRRVFG